MKKLIQRGTGLIVLLSCFSLGFAQTNDAILFVGEGCSHCAQVEKYLEDQKQNERQIQIKEVYNSPQNAQEFVQACEEQKIPLLKRGVPMLLIDDQCVFGADSIIDILAKKDQEAPILQKAEKSDTYTNKKLSIPLVVGAAIVDAINPCAFAVLIILLSALLITSTPKRALYAGFAFSSSIFLSYFLMGIGLYSVLSTVQTSNTIVTIIGSVAILLGLINIKDYFRYGKGVLLEVPVSRRPKMRRIIESVASPLGAFCIGFVVSLFLLPCTSGPYIVIIGMLGQEQTYRSAIRYLLLYNFIFVVPMLLITIAIYKGLDVDQIEDLRQKHLPTLHLVAGILLLIIGFVLVF